MPLLYTVYYGLVLIEHFPALIEHLKLDKPHSPSRIHTKSVSKCLIYPIIHAHAHARTMHRGQLEVQHLVQGCSDM